MTELLELLASKGFDSKENLKRDIFKLSDEKLMMLVDEMQMEVNKSDQNLSEYTPYTFVASSDMAGTSGCMETSCKLSRAHDFSLFSSLYADKVYVNFSSINNPHFFEIYKGDSYGLRYSIANDLLLINEYAPLIKNNIIQIPKPELQLCKECANKIIGTDLEGEHFDKILEHYSTSITVEAFLDEGSFGYNLKNLIDLFEHDEMIFEDNDMPNSIKKKVKASTDNRYLLSYEECIEFRIIEGFLTNELNTLRINALESRLFNTKYLTSRVFDSKVLDSAFQQKNNQPISINSTFPLYSLPILSEVPIEKILDIRKSYYSAFLDYRVAINKAAKEQQKGMTAKGLNEIYEDVIYPSFVDLEKCIANFKTGTLKKALGNVTVIASSVGIGVSTGLVPTDVASIVTALGGVTALTTAGSKLVDWSRSKDELKDNDFYFLWKLIKS